jgi:hypothetical protein
VHNQVDAFTQSTSKTAAAARMHEAGIGTRHPGAVRVAGPGHEVQIFLAAGLFGPETVLVTALTRADVVVSIDHENHATVAGEFKYDETVRERVLTTSDGRRFYYSRGAVQQLP